MTDTTEAPWKSRARALQADYYEPYLARKWITQQPNNRKCQSCAKAGTPCTLSVSRVQCKARACRPDKANCSFVFDCLFDRLKAELGDDFDVSREEFDAFTPTLGLAGPSSVRYDRSGARAKKQTRRTPNRKSSQRNRKPRGMKSTGKDDTGSDTEPDVAVISSDIDSEGDAKTSSMIDELEQVPDASPHAPSPQNISQRKKLRVSDTSAQKPLRLTKSLPKTRVERRVPSLPATPVLSQADNHPNDESLTSHLAKRPRSVKSPGNDNASAGPSGVAHEVIHGRSSKRYRRSDVDATDPGFRSPSASESRHPFNIVQRSTHGAASDGVMQDKLLEVQTLIGDIQNAAHAAEEAVRIKAEEATDLATELAIARDAVDRLRSELDKSVQDRDNMVNSFEIVTNDLAKEKSNIVDLQTTIQVLTRTISTSAESNAALTAEVEMLKGSIEEYKRNIASDERRLEVTMGANKSLLAAIDRAEGQRVALLEKNQSTISELAVATRESAAVRAQYTSLQDRYAVLQAQLNAHQQEPTPGPAIKREPIKQEVIKEEHDASLPPSRKVFELHFETMNVHKVLRDAIAPSAPSQTVDSLADLIQSQLPVLLNIADAHMSMPHESCSVNAEAEEHDDEAGSGEEESDPNFV